MGAFTDQAFETSALILNGGAGIYAQGDGDTGLPWIDTPDAPTGSLYLRANGERFIKTASTGSGVEADWSYEATSGTGASVQFDWKFNTNTSVGSRPSAGEFKYNNATPASVTILSIHEQTEDNGVDLSTLISLLGAGDQLYIQEFEDGSRAQLFTVTADVTAPDSTTFDIPVSFDSGGARPRDGKECLVIFLFGGATDIALGDTFLLQARRTSTQSFTSEASIAFDTLDYESDPVNQIEQTTDTTFQVKQDGRYVMQYSIPISDGFGTLRAKVNGTPIDGGTVGLVGSDSVEANVTALGSWETAAADSQGTPAFSPTIPAGTDRLFVINCTAEDPSSITGAVTSITIGGVELVGNLIYPQQVADTGFTNYCASFYATEADIAAMTGTTLAITYSGTNPQSKIVSARTFANVDQTTPIRDSDAATVTTGAAATTPAIDVEPTDILIGAQCLGGTDASALSTTPAGLVQLVDTTGVDAAHRHSAGELASPPSGTATVTATASIRSIAYGFSLQPPTGGQPASKNTRRFETGLLSANDVITVDFEPLGSADVGTNAIVTFEAFSGVKGEKGDKGDPGIGSTIALEDGGTPVSGGPFDTINIIGAQSVSDAGGGTADVDVTPPTPDPSVLVKTASDEIGTDVTTTATLASPAVLMTVNITPDDASNSFIIQGTFSGDLSGSDDGEISFQVWYGLSGSETQQRSCFIFHDSSGKESGSAAITIKRAALGPGQHTIQIRWGRTTSTARIRPITDPDYDHAALTVLEVTD